jgi:photosystem II stability/assembly factor-like uncharacterized protein
MKPAFPRHIRTIAVAVAVLATIGLLATAQAQSRGGQLSESSYRALQFRSIGPAIMGGRIDDFAVVESNPHIIYAATASGGLWKTPNNGVTWEPIFDNEAVSSIGDVTVAPSNPDIVWVGTGEANNRQSSSWGNGVYKSTDGGKTWKNAGLKDSHHIGRIIIHPKNPDIVYVAALGHLWGPNRERGLFKTIDGGRTWTNTKFINEDTGFIDAAMDWEDPDTLYAAAYQRRRTPFGFNGGGPHSGLYKTTDGGATWTKLSDGLPAGDAGRIGIDVYRKDSRIVYVTYENANGGVFRSEDRGATWKKMNDINPRPSYYSKIRIDPQNDLRIYVLGASMYFSDNGGKTLAANPFMRIHGDYHAMWINPSNPDHLIVGSDGGIHFSYDRAKSWDYVNTIPLGQFYEIGFDFRKPYWVYGGLQDNGTWGAPAMTLNVNGPSNDEWIRVGGGDGFYAQVDPKDPATVYIETQNGNIQRLNRATGEGKSIKPQPEEGAGERYRFDWNSPILISPHNNRKIFLGGNRLFISTDRGDTWDVVTPDLTNNLDRDRLEIMGAVPRPNMLSGHDGQETYGHIVTIAESPLKEGVLYVGTDDGNVQVSRDGGRNWRNVIDRIPGVPANTYVTRIIASHAAPGRAYVTFDGHRNDDFKPYVFVTEDFGETWNSITSNLPHPANVIREHDRNQNLLFVGTEFGLFVSFNRGASWLAMKNNLPTVPVDDIAIHPRENDLILGTHGRSIWVLDDMTPIEQMNEIIAAAEAHLFDIRPATMWRLSNHKGSTGHKTFIAPNPMYGAIINYYLREKARDRIRVAVYDKGGNLVREITPVNETGIHRIAWDLRHQSPLYGQAQNPGGDSLLALRGPRAIPGDYTVKLIVDDSEWVKTVRVEEDPRIGITLAHAEARLKTLLAINRLQRTANSVQTGLNNLRSQLNSLRENLKRQSSGGGANGNGGGPNNGSGNGTHGTEAAIAAAGALSVEVNELLRRLSPQSAGPNAQEAAGPADPAALDALLPRINQLFNFLDSYTERPSTRHERQIQSFTTQLNSLIEKLNRVIAEGVPSLNKQISESGITPIKTGDPIPLLR